LGSDHRTIDMKRLLLLGLAGLGLVALAPTGSKADESFRVYIGPADQRPYYDREDYPRLWGVAFAHHLLVQFPDACLRQGF
jgi:hypothetical protein